MRPVVNLSSQAGNSNSEEAENCGIVRTVTAKIRAFAPLHLLAVGSVFSQCTAQSCCKLQLNLILPNES